MKNEILVIENKDKFSLSPSINEVSNSLLEVACIAATSNNEISLVPRNPLDSHIDYAPCRIAETDEDVLTIYHGDEPEEIIDSEQFGETTYQFGFSIPKKEFIDVFEDDDETFFTFVKLIDYFQIDNSNETNVKNLMRTIKVLKREFSLDVALHRLFQLNNEELLELISTEGITSIKRFFLTHTY